MERKQGLVSIVEALADLPGPVTAVPAALPQARHHFTRFDQVDQLVGASEANPERGFMARMMTLCSLPRTNPGNRIRYIRQNGPYTLYMTAGDGCKLPFGNFPRLLLAWVSTEAVQTQSRELILGASLSKFMRKLGVYKRCCMDRGGDGIRPFPSGSVRRCVRTQAVRVRSLCSGLSGRPGSP